MKMLCENVGPCCSHCKHSKPHEARDHSDCDGGVCGGLPTRCRPTSEGEGEKNEGPD